MSQGSGPQYSAMAALMFSNEDTKAYADLLEECTDPNSVFHGDKVHLNRDGIAFGAPIVAKICRDLEADVAVSDSCLCAAEGDWQDSLALASTLS